MQRLSHRSLNHLSVVVVAEADSAVMTKVDAGASAVDVEAGQEDKVVVAAPEDLVADRR